MLAGLPWEREGGREAATQRDPACEREREREMEGDEPAPKTEAQLKKERAKAELEAAKLKTQEEAAKAAEAGKKEGKKKMGYLARGVKSKYLEKAGNLQLPAEESRRRAEYMQPLLDSLKTAKGSYAGVRSAAEKAIANSKASAAAQIDFALAVCDNSFLQDSPCASALPSFQEAHHELSKISAAFIETMQKRVLEPAVNSVAAVDDARSKKEKYYEERQNYDFALLKLQEGAKKMQEEQDPVKKEKAVTEFTAAQAAFKESEPPYREAERVLAEAIAVVRLPLVASNGNACSALTWCLRVRSARLCLYMCVCVCVCACVCVCVCVCACVCGWVSVSGCCRL